MSKAVTESNPISGTIKAFPSSESHAPLLPNRLKIISDNKMENSLMNSDPSSSNHHFSPSYGNYGMAMSGYGFSRGPFSTLNSSYHPTSFNSYGPMHSYNGGTNSALGTTFMSLSERVDQTTRPVFQLFDHFLSMIYGFTQMMDGTYYVAWTSINSFVNLFQRLNSMKESMFIGSDNLFKYIRKHSWLIILALKKWLGLKSSNRNWNEEWIIKSNDSGGTSNIEQWTIEKEQTIHPDSKPKHQVFFMSSAIGMLFKSTLSGILIFAFALATYHLSLKLYQYLQSKYMTSSSGNEIPDDTTELVSLSKPFFGRVLYDFHSDQPDDLFLNKDELVAVIKIPSSYKSDDKKESYEPHATSRTIGSVSNVLYNDYEQVYSSNNMGYYNTGGYTQPRRALELDVKKIQETGPTWLVGRTKDGRIGQFPSNYIQLLPS